MHLAVLMTNTDESAFAQKHPKDGEKFTSMIHRVRPDWAISIYDVKGGVFPDDICAFDGIMITGSPASVLDKADWITQLLVEIRVAHAAGKPIFGACFGHQAIALALGGKVEKNPAGWAFGLVEMSVKQRVDWYDGPDTLLQYGAHTDHVVKLPKEAELIFSAEHCCNAGFVVGDRVYTTQNHPEMTPSFMRALVDEYADHLGAEVATRAKASLDRGAQTDVFARSIARFFEQAAAI